MRQNYRQQHFFIASLDPHPRIPSDINCSTEKSLLNALSDPDRLYTPRIHSRVAELLLINSSTRKKLHAFNLQQNGSKLMMTNYRDAHKKTSTETVLCFCFDSSLMVINLNYLKALDNML